MLRNRVNQALRPLEVQPAQNRFILEGVYLYPEEKVEFSKRSFVLATPQKLLASARALASDGSSASIAEPLHEAVEDHATIRNFFACIADRSAEPVTESSCKVAEATLHKVYL